MLVAISSKSAVSKPVRFRFWGNAQSERDPGKTTQKRREMLLHMGVRDRGRISKEKMLKRVSTR